MDFQVFYTKIAVKDIAKLDLIVKKYIKSKIEYYQKNPTQFARKLIKSNLGEYRWRAGKYRIIFDLDQSKKMIIILRVRHRKEVYRI